MKVELDYPLYTPGKIAVAIPCFRVKAHIVDLIASIGPEVSNIYVIDDDCPDQTGFYVDEMVTDPRVRVLHNDENLGVGGAVLRGFQAAQQDGCSVAVKIDGDGQMDPKLIMKFVNPILKGNADYTKGNRFYSTETLGKMPKGRILGNAILSFVTKFSTGYWQNFDPTNGFLAIDLRMLAAIPVDKVHKRYFFESDMLFRCYLARAKVVDIPMRAIYEDEVSNLHFSKEVFPFMVGNLTNFLKRLGYNYFVRDFNIGSIELLFGLLLLGMGLIHGGINYFDSSVDSAGVVMITGLLILTGIQLLLSFLNFDMQQVPNDPIAPLLDERAPKTSSDNLVEMK